jgi:hypothetical protein
MGIQPATKQEIFKKQDSNLIRQVKVIQVVFTDIKQTNKFRF